MKLWFFCLLAAIAVAPRPAAAAPPLLTEITVNGSGTVWLAPDVAIVSAGVDSNSASAADALAENNRSYERIVASLARIGIARTDIALRQYGVTYNAPPPVLPANPSGERYGYTVSRSFSVRVRDIAKAGEVTDACIGAGATAINGVGFEIADAQPARERAIAAAVADARKNAELLARDSSLRIVRVKSVALNNATYFGEGTIARVTARSTAFDQGQVNVEASVTVVFLATP
jgi:hypothetical protein